MEYPQDVRASLGSFVVGLYSCYSHKVKCTIISTIISKYMLTCDMYGERGNLWNLLVLSGKCRSLILSIL